MTTFYSALVVMQWFAALVLVVEAINKSEKCAVLRPELTLLQRLSTGLKALAWIAVALAAGGVLIAPVLRAIAMPAFLPMWINPMPSISECGIFLGMAVLVLRRWIACLVLEIKAKRSRSGDVGSSSSAAAALHQPQG